VGFETRSVIAPNAAQSTTSSEMVIEYANVSAVDQWENNRVQA
jgi:hypothetical protein